MDNMSDLQKSFVKSRLAKLPPDIPLFEDDSEGSSNNESPSTSTKFGSIAEEDGDSSSSASSTGTIVPSPRQKLFARSGSGVFSNLLFFKRF
jgi:protein phosphatase methylesterase 1